MDFRWILSPTLRRLTGATLVAGVTLLGGVAGDRADASSAITHGPIKSCAVVAQPDAATALRHRIVSHRSWRTGGFSECLLISKSGFFVMVDLASTKMLTRHFHRTISASQELSYLRRHGIKGDLQRIGPNIALAPGEVIVDRQDDVVGFDTFGFFHRVRRIPDQTERLVALVVTVLSRF